MDIYSLSRNFWDYSFENPDRIKPNHAAIYFFAIEHCNRLGWKEKFGLPTTMVMEAVGIKNYKTYHNTLMDLVEIGLIKLVEKSKNQYSANVIALVNFTKAHTKALDKALLNHTAKQGRKQVQSIASIDIPINNTTILPNYNITLSEMLKPHLERLGSEYENFYSYWTEKNKSGKERWEKENFFNIERRITTWLNNSNKFNNGNSNNESKKGTSAARMEAIKNW